MKRIGFLLLALFFGLNSVAETVNITWKNGDTTYDTSTCTIGNDLMVPSIPPTKPGYTFVGWQVKSAKELEYVTFQIGGGSYIDTGIQFDSDEIEYETKLAFNQLFNSVAFGAEGTCDMDATTPTLVNSAGSVSVRGVWNRVFLSVGDIDTNYGISKQREVNIYKIRIKKSTNSVTTTMNDNVTENVLRGTITTDKNIRIGQLNTNNTNFQNCGFGGNIYYFKIKKDGVLVRDFVPVKNFDGVVCFYDRVEHSFFYPQGANLVAGPIKG